MDRLNTHSTAHNGATFPHVTCPRIAGCVGALIVGVFTASLGWALPSCPVYPATISACCVADLAGQEYMVGADLTAARNCIKISAPNVLFDLNGRNVTGAYTGIGVHVLSTAANAVVISQVFAPAMVTHFTIGFKTDAPNTVVAEMITDFNIWGVVFNGRGATGKNFLAIGSVQNGITLTPAASGSYLYGAQAWENSKSGIVLNRTSGVAIRYPIAIRNYGYGLWLKGASSNFVYEGELEGNGVAGAYLGCHADGPSAAGCTIPPSNDNSIQSSFDYDLLVGSCPRGTQINQPYGIVIDKGNRHNHVLYVRTDSSSKCANPGDTAYDGYDGNGVHCGENVWYKNFFSSMNHTFSVIRRCMS